jgi:hypothetical protein
MESYVYGHDFLFYAFAFRLRLYSLHWLFMTAIILPFNYHCLPQMSILTYEQQGMSRINFTPGEEKELLQILQRCLPDLEREMADTDRKGSARSLKKEK